MSEQSTTFLPSPMIAVAVHPAYESASSEYDIAAIRIDLENFNGPPLPFQATPIGHLSKGVIRLFLSCLYSCRRRRSKRHCPNRLLAKCQTDYQGSNASSGMSIQYLTRM